jgi:ribosomal protein S18 acetylase RimI-like enzyme
MEANPTIAQARDGLAVFELLWAARDEIPLKPSFNHDQNEKWITKRCDEGYVWVIKNGDTIVGALVLGEGEVFYLVVSASHRGQGIGRSLLQEVKRPGRWLRIAPGNAAMIKLVESEGFRHDPDRLTAAGWDAYTLT